MSKAQNKQLYPYLPKSKTSKLIKFCYIILPLFVYSCGDTKTEKTTENQETVQQTEDASFEKNKTIEIGRAHV